MTIKKGEFVAIVGDIGSGKSSMLKAMLGEMINFQKDSMKKVLGEDSTTATETDENIRAAITKELLGNAFDNNRPVKQINDNSMQVNGPICYIE